MINQKFSAYQIFQAGNGIPQKMVQDFITYIPENDLGISLGYYEANDIASLLRKHRFEPETIQFIADMLEV